MTYTGTVSGADYSISATFPHPVYGGITTVNINFTLSSSTQGSGLMTWSWTDGGNVVCNGGSDYSTTKLVTCSPDSYEPDDTPGQATPLGSSSTTLSGSEAKEGYVTGSNTTGGGLITEETTTSPDGTTDSGSGADKGAGEGNVNYKFIYGIEKVIKPEFLNALDIEGSVDIIVLLKDYKAFEGTINSNDTVQMATQQAQISTLQANVLNRLDPNEFTLKHRFENILGFSGKATVSGITDLALMPEVEVIQEDSLVEMNLAQGIPLMNATVPRNTYDGTGVSVAIVDTGIDYNHPMLGGAPFPNTKVIGGRDLGDNDADPMDCQSHGTACAGLAAGTLSAGPGDYIGGVAHNANYMP